MIGIQKLFCFFFFFYLVRLCKRDVLKSIIFLLSRKATTITHPENLVASVETVRRHIRPSAREQTLELYLLPRTRGRLVYQTLCTQKGREGGGGGDNHKKLCLRIISLKPICIVFLYLVSVKKAQNNNTNLCGIPLQNIIVLQANRTREPHEG